MKRIAITSLFIAMAAPVAAQDLAPVTSPKPVQGTTRSKAPDGQATKVQAVTAESSSVFKSAVSPNAPEISTATGMRDQLRETDIDFNSCLVTLDEIGVSYSKAEPIISPDDVDCGILRPLTVSQIAPGVAITPPAILRCETAQALSIWTRDFVLPAAARLTERGPLTSIENGSGYVCRRRNNQSDGKLSEHAFGNAFDVMAFGFGDDSRLVIEPRETEGSMEEAFQDAVRASACLEFSTVLGPGSNAAHADHLHLDIIARKSNYRLCEQGGVDPD